MKLLKPGRWCLQIFVKQLNVIRLQDSLLNLSTKDSSYLISYFRTYLEEEQAKKLEDAKKRKKESKSQNTGNANIDPDQKGFSVDAGNTGGQWYFYNITAISRGRVDFQGKWGDRPLEDNWRRSLRVRSQDNPNIDPEEETNLTFDGQRIIPRRAPPPKKPVSIMKVKLQS